MTAVPEVLAARIMRLPQFVTWEMPPGAEAISARVRVWMESTMTRSNSPPSMVFAISLAEVLLANFRLSDLAPRRTARSLTWPADSSPEIYNTVRVSAILAQICMRRVDLPMPGWPARSETEPRRMPPPRTVSRSGNPVFRRSFSFETARSLIEAYFRSLPEACPRETADFSSRASSGICSTREFQAPHLLQRPFQLV